MTDNILYTLFVLAVILIVIILPTMWLVRLRRASQAKQQKVRLEQRAHFEQRQLNPNFAAFVTRYGCEPPPPLRRLYEDREGVLDENFEITTPSGDVHFIAWFEPMDDKEWPEFEGSYLIANDGCGNQFQINPRDPDPEVIFYDHETGQREPVGLRLSQFLSAKRTR